MALLRNRTALMLGATALVGACTHSGSFAPPANKQDLSEFEVFSTPAADESAGGIDYLAYAQMLGTIVYDVGSSDRIPPPRPQQMTASRIQRQNSSRYRLEANRIVFSLQPSALAEVTAEITDSFKAVAESDAYDQLSSDERLAFWLNFHNALLINQMAAEYPFQRINTLNATGTGTPVFSTDIITVRGVPLSLNDIKYNIVYETWSEPLVLYGFFTGAVGGPNIRKEPFRGANVRAMLKENAEEFVNSLRGVEIEGAPNRISRIYKDSAALFPGGAEDVVDHLLEYANTNTRSALQKGAPVRADVFDWVVADISFGRMPPPIVPTSLTFDGIGLSGFLNKYGFSPQAEQFVKEVETRKIRIRNLREGVVTIDDAPERSQDAAPADDAEDNGGDSE